MPEGSQKASAYEYKKGKGWQKVEPELSSPKSIEVAFVEKQRMDPKEQGNHLVPPAATKNVADRAKGKRSIDLGHFQPSAKSDISYDAADREANLTVVQSQVNGSVNQGEAEREFNVGASFLGASQDAPSRPAPPGIPGAPGAGPMAARVGDLTSHGSPLSPGIGSPNVFIGGLPAWRAAMDFHACPVVKGVVPDVGGTVAVGDPTVLINGMMACRMGDMVVEVPGGPNPIVTGCPTVMIGPADNGGAGGPGGVPGKGGSETDFKPSGKAKEDVLAGESPAEAAAKWTAKEKGDGAKIGPMAAVSKGTLEEDISVPIPFTDDATKLGAQEKGTFVPPPAEADASAKWTKEDRFRLEPGADLAGAGDRFFIGFE